MKKYSKLFLIFGLLAPFFCLSQVTPQSKDSIVKKAPTDSLAIKADTAIAPKKDTVIVTDTSATRKDCYTEWYDAFRTRGAKPVTDGMQQVIISLKTAESCQCFMGQIEVVGGKIKSPLYFQQEDGQYRAVSVVGKKLEPAFAGSMSPEELYNIKDGMSIVFRTADQEYGRLFFYKFINKSAQANKTAPSPSELIKE